MRGVPFCDSKDLYSLSTGRGIELCGWNKHGVPYLQPRTSIMERCELEPCRCLLVLHCMIVIVIVTLETLKPMLPFCLWPSRKRLIDAMPTDEAYSSSIDN
jgi:hypothetical protein